jgi:hypothetical protein
MLSTSERPSTHTRMKLLAVAAWLLASYRACNALFSKLFRPLAPPPKAAPPEKAAFLAALERGPDDAKEACLTALVATNPTSAPCSEAALKRFSTGTWQVIYAPHIRILEKFTFTTYDVSYSFRNDGTMVSYVRYASPLFQSGWLNTAGRVERVTDVVCRVVWDQIWLDWNSEAQGPSGASETDAHVLPGLIQSVGERGFVEGVSRFPVLYLDDDLCVFEFQITGTKICARRA